MERPSGEKDKKEEEQAGEHGGEEQTPSDSGGARGDRRERPPFFSGWEKSIPIPEEREPEEEEKPSPEPRKNETIFDSSRGPIHIENYCPVERLEGLAVDDGICMFSRNNPERQKTALVKVGRSDGGNVIAGTHDDVLVSYIGIHYPSENERWGKPEYPWLYEFGAIEVSRAYRRLGLAEKMLEVAFDDPFYDDKIVLTTGFTWHWDLEKTGLTKMQYREFGIKLFGRYGFMEMATDEPNVVMDSANLFLVRVGKDASFSKYQKFASMLFTNEWEAMLRGF